LSASPATWRTCQRRAHWAEPQVRPAQTGRGHRQERRRPPGRLSKNRWPV
jgi:hypothetical protein